MKKATQSEERSRPRKVDSISSVLHSFIIDCLIGTLIALALFGAVWLLQVLS